MSPDDPLHREYPPLQPKPEPFDLDALPRLSSRASRRFRWRRRKRSSHRDDPAPTVTSARPSVALLALLPGPEQCAAIRGVLAASGAPYAVPPRLPLRNGLSLEHEAAWRNAIQQVTRSWPAFTVLLRAPELLDQRMVCLAPVGDAVPDLQYALSSSLSAAGFVPRAGDVGAPLLLLAGTFTGLSQSQLYGLIDAVRDRMTFPMEFAASTVYAVAEAPDDRDLPVDAFPLEG